MDVYGSWNILHYYIYICICIYIYIFVDIFWDIFDGYFLGYRTNTMIWLCPWDESMKSDFPIFRCYDSNLFHKNHNGSKQ